LTISNPLDPWIKYSLVKLQKKGKSANDEKIMPVKFPLEKGSAFLSLLAVSISIKHL
jgi:hypothetical protein